MMPDASIAMWLKLSESTLAQDLQDACERLEDADGEMLLDLSAVRRVDPVAVAALDRLADSAAELGVRIVLRGVNVEVYKVLKLMKLTPDFSFVD